MINKAVITGASGFVGANLCQRLLDDGYEIHLFMRASFNGWRLLDILPRVKIHIVDFLNSKELIQTLDKIKPDYIFHLAAHGAYSFQKNTTEIFQTNILGTQKILDASVAVGFQAFVNTGSSSEYGFKKQIHNESEIVEPNSAYAVSKVTATHYCSYIAKENRLRIPTLRLYSIYGAFEDPSRLMPTLIQNAFEGKYPPLVSPNIARDFVYIDDAVDAFLDAANKTPAACSEVFNVSSGTQSTINDIVKIVQSQFKISESPKWGEMEARSWDSDCWVGNNKKINQTTGWSPKTSLAQGIQKFELWFNDNPQFRQIYEKKKK